MSYLLKKSNDNFNAALTLSTEPKARFCSSIHCAYYSCLQMIIHILLDQTKKTEIEIRQLANDSKNTHIYYINEVRKLVETRNPKDVLVYKKIDDLKDFRVKSDYHDQPITEQQSSNATGIAQQIRDLLIRIFKIS
ncbi:MAG: hypothetical protein KA285_04220 [Bacteroidia bacterium]|nr:hypothetical protein [Bacteroidia bacterium]